MDECKRIMGALLSELVELASIAPAALACLVVLAVVDVVLIVRVGLDNRTEARDGEPLEEWAKRDIARAGARASAVLSLCLTMVSVLPGAVSYEAAKLGSSNLSWFVITLFLAVVMVAVLATARSAWCSYL